ncbi:MULTISPECIES: Uma2 family endonuclease [unclassified Moorena]|uniref:Uma2 family endonuclease n=1 Tax=unclassified Moorena TaxID=2683338 RepID=UPI0013C5A20F|nr:MULTISPECIES: Uma2 family endonuclease [unclassified Moorena]NEO22140.1 Uma2 family endonuclease [Moorena sp. SIO4A5]NEO50975.1 Uma2 family endonuclease [Moorena sp. SIO4A3]NEQ60147.1 Uma2 family endonuclease [Moorena sp. SIO4A1]
MVQAVSKLLTFDEFLEQYPEDGGNYELRQGRIVAMRPTGLHEQVAALIARKLDVEIERLSLPYFIPRTCLVKPYQQGEGYLPDIIVLDKQTVAEDPYWKQKSSISIGKSAKLIVEVVSTNWQDDYLTKLAEYEKFGIPEYWIVDYKALGGTRYIGSPKIPTVWIYELADNEYKEGKTFTGCDSIESPIFPELKLTVDQLVKAGT